MLTKESIDRRMERGKPLEQPTAAAQLEELRRRADVYVQILTKLLDNLEINTCTTDERMPAQRQHQNTIWHLEKALVECLRNTRQDQTTEEIVKRVEELGSSYKADQKCKLPKMQWKQRQFDHSGKPRRIITRDFKALLLHMECVAGVNALRVLLNRKCLVGIMGTQDAGKSTLRNLLAGQTDNDTDIGQDVHTGLPVVKGLAREQGDGIPDGMKVLLMDLPGMNPAQDVGIAEMTTAVGADLYGIIFVTEVKADMNGDQLNHLEKLLHFDRPILICANKASTHWVNSFKRRNAGRMPEHRHVKRVTQSWKDVIQNRASTTCPHFKPANITVLVTELLETDQLDNTGISGEKEIVSWIAELTSGS